VPPEFSRPEVLDVLREHYGAADFGDATLARG
jgi:ATP sulfurylase